MPDIAPSVDRAATMRGLASLTSALDCIGNEPRSSDMTADQNLAKQICDGELDLRALIKFALAKLTLEL